MKNLITLIALCLSFTSIAQKYAINGKVVDSTETALPFATVAALSPEDSVAQGFGITDKNGLFSIELENPGKYIVRFVLVGYATISDNVELTEGQPTVAMGNVVMTDDQVLKSVDITAEHIPVLIKEDTVEYNAEAFKTDPNAPVEDMLSKMPGIEVDKDGNIKAHGEDVDKIYVDGKEFFGDDPKVATKNLPADAVKKVQVYDRKSETAEFTGVDDGSRNKTINIELKEDKKKGGFGNITGGAGYPDFTANSETASDDMLYKFKGNYNKFNKKLQFSVIGMANNTSEDGFSWEDYVSFMGGMSRMSRGGGGFNWSALPIGNGLGNGLINTASAGLNFNYTFKKNTELSVSYFAYRAHKDLNKSLLRNNFLDTIVYNTRENSLEESTQWIHRSNIRFDHQIDTLRELTFKSSIEYRTDGFEGLYDNMTTSEEGDTLNYGARTNEYSGDGLDLSGSLIYKNKFKKVGRNFVIQLDGALGNSLYNGVLYNESAFFNGFGATYDTLDQDMTDDSYYGNWEAYAAYTEPLGKNRFLEIDGGYAQNHDDNLYDVYDIENDVSPQFNSMLSSNFVKGQSYYYTGAAFRWIKNKFNINPGVEVRWTDLEGRDILRDTTISRDFNAVLPYVTLNWNPRQTTRFRVRYKTDQNVPGIEQLQTRVDNSDPFNITVGNPDLKPEYEHNLSIHGGSFSQFSMSGFYAGLTAAYTQDKIQYATTVTNEFVNITQPINVDKDLSGFFYGGYYRPLNKLGVKMNIRVNGGYNRGYFFINDVETQTTGQNGSVTLSVENKKKDKFDLAFGGTLSGNITTYDNPTYRDQVFSAISGWIETDWKITKKWTLRSEFNYSTNQSQAYDDVIIIPLWKASFSRYMGANNRAELRVETFDILNRNRGIDRTVTNNYYQETRTNAIGRYFMLSFTYRLNKMGGEEKMNFRMHRK